MKNDYLYVMALCQKRSFSKAAKSLYISQPALSKAISSLEKELGAVLFDRSTNDLQPTEACLFYLQCAKQIADTENSIHDYFNSLRNLEAGTLSIGTTSFYCCYSLPRSLQPFSRLHPGLQINLIEQTSNQQLLAMLKNGTLDLALSVNPHGFEAFQRQFFEKEYLILSVPASWPINSTLQDAVLSYEDIMNGSHRQKDCPSVSLSAFGDQPYISLRHDSELYGRVMGMFGRLGSHPHIQMYADQMPTTYFLSLYGYGYALIRDNTLKTVPKPEKSQVVFYRIDDPLAVRDVYFYFRPLAYQSAALKAYLSFLH